MPIYINLLAEAHEIEVERRRDPVKRSAWCAGLIIAGMLCWSGMLQFKVMMARADFTRSQSLLDSQDGQYRRALDGQAKLATANHKLQALSMLATNRLLYGNLLSALQQTSIDDVQLTRFQAMQTFSYTEEVKAKTNDDRVIPARPATVTENITFTFDAKDASANPGDRVNKLKQAIADCAYFEQALGKSNEVRLARCSPPQAVGGKSFVLFNLECRLPEKIR